MTPTEELPTKRASNSIDLKPAMCPPAPERNNKNNPNLNFVGSKEGPTLKNIPVSHTSLLVTQLYYRLCVQLTELSFF